MKRSLVAVGVVAGLATALAVTYAVAPEPVTESLAPILPVDDATPAPSPLVPASPDVDRAAVTDLPAPPVAEVALQLLETPVPLKVRDATLAAEGRARSLLGGEAARPRPGQATGGAGTESAVPASVRLAPVGASLVRVSAGPGEDRRDERTAVRVRRAVGAAALGSRSRKGETRTATVTTTRDPRAKLTTRSVERLSGNPCPDAQGQVELTVEVEVTATLRGERVTQWLQAEVGAVIDAVAQVSEAAARVQARTERSGGEEPLLEEGFVRLDGEEGLGEVTDPNGAPASSPVPEPVESVALADARALAVGALAGAREQWREGGCVALDLDFPRVVETDSETTRRVRVTSLVGGDRIPAEVSVETRGPGRAAMGPDGRLVFVAGPRRDQQTTLILVATSARGRARTEVQVATTPADLRVAGTWRDDAVSGVKCRGPEGAWRLAFSSGGTATGEMEFSLGRDLAGRFAGSRSFSSPLGTITVSEQGGVRYDRDQQELVVRTSEGEVLQLAVQTGAFC